MKNKDLKIALLLAGWIFFAGCAPDATPTAGDAGSDAGADGGAIGPCGAQGCANVIDAVVVPMLVENGFSIVPEDEGVLCRRMAIDLTGMAPTTMELDGICHGHSPSELADYFMNKPSGPNAPDGSPPYVFVNRRWWADSFLYQVGTEFGDNKTFYSYILDLDGWVAKLYSGAIGYDQFARQALASPAFARRFGVFEANHDLIQIASQAYRVFLGREALPSEAADFGDLWRPWTYQRMYGGLAGQLYPACPLLCGPRLCDCAHDELALDGSACAGANQIGCESGVLGPGAVIPSLSGIVEWRDLPAQDRATLETPGRLMAASPSFADAAVDRALTKYLGWWKTGWYRPDFDIPAVREALSKKLIADHDLRALDREIVTSVLYTQAASLQPTENPLDPIWAFGPTKVVYGEAWLDSLAQATGRPLGGCDFRYNNDSTHLSQYVGYLKFPVSGVPSSFAGYERVAQDLGGCPLAAPHGSAEGLVPVISRQAALVSLCTGAFKPSAGMTLMDLFKQEYRAMGRNPTGDEVNTWVAAMSVPADGGCDPNDLGACNLQQLADNLCVALYASAQFTYY